MIQDGGFSSSAKPANSISKQADKIEPLNVPNLPKEKKPDTTQKQKTDQNLNKGQSLLDDCLREEKSGY